MAEPGVEVRCVSVCLVFAFGKISSQMSRSNKGETGNDSCHPAHLNSSSLIRVLRCDISSDLGANTVTAGSAFSLSESDCSDPPILRGQREEEAAGWSSKLLSLLIRNNPLS